MPETLPELTTRRALAMEWIEGRHLQDLKPEEAARMTYMAVEAVTAGLCLTGLVHADPHEGNIMLADNGDLVFLRTFGSTESSPRRRGHLRSLRRRDPVRPRQRLRRIGPGFSGHGIRRDPINWRAKDGDAWQDWHPSGKAVMAEEVERRMVRRRRRGRASAPWPRCWATWALRGTCLRPLHHFTYKDVSHSGRHRESSGPGF